MSSSNGYVSGKPELSWWLGQIRRGIDYRKKNAYEASWDRWRKYYRGEFKPGILPINLFFRMARMTVPQVYFRDPVVSINPTKPGLDQLAHAQLIERLDNKLIRLMHVKQSMKRMVDIAFFYGTSYGKLGFGSQYAYSQEQQDAGKEYGDLGGKEKLEYSSLVKEDMPWFCSGHPRNLIVPEGVVSFEDSRWIAEWVTRPVVDVKADPRFKHTKDLKPSKGRGLLNMVTKFFGDKMDFRPDDIDLIVIKDLKFGKVMVLAPYATDKVLLYEDDPMQYDGRFGMYSLQFNMDNECFWAVPDSKILEPQQLEINEINTQIMKHRRLSLVKILTEGANIDEAEAEKLLDESVGAVVNVKSINKLKVMTPGDIPPSLITALRNVEENVRENLGFSRNQLGDYASGSADRTATEANIVKQASEIRTDERRDSVIDVMVDMTPDLNRLIFDRWTDEHVEMVIGPQGMPVWVQFKPKDLSQAKYDVNIDPDNALPRTRQVRLQESSQFYQLLKTNPLIDPEKLTRYFLSSTGQVELEDTLRGMGAMRQQPGGNPGQPTGLNQYVQQLQQAQGQGNG